MPRFKFVVQSKSKASKASEPGRKHRRRIGRAPKNNHSLDDEPGETLPSFEEKETTRQLLLSKQASPTSPASPASCTASSRTTRTGRSSGISKYRDLLMPSFSDERKHDSRNDIDEFDVDRDLAMSPNHGQHGRFSFSSSASEYSYASSTLPEGVSASYSRASSSDDSDASESAEWVTEVFYLPRSGGVQIQSATVTRCLPVLQGAEESRTEQEIPKDVSRDPEESPREAPGDTPGDIPRETSGETPRETPSEKQEETLGEKPSEKPSETLVSEIPSEKPSETLVSEIPSETLVSETTRETQTDASTEVPNPPQDQDAEQNSKPSESSEAGDNKGATHDITVNDDSSHLNADLVAAHKYYETNLAGLPTPSSTTENEVTTHTGTTRTVTAHTTTSHTATTSNTAATSHTESSLWPENPSLLFCFARAIWHCAEGSEEKLALRCGIPSEDDYDDSDDSDESDDEALEVVEKQSKKKEQGEGDDGEEEDDDDDDPTDEEKEDGDKDDDDDDDKDETSDDNHDDDGSTGEFTSGWTSAGEYTSGWTTAGEDTTLGGDTTDNGYGSTTGDDYTLENDDDTYTKGGCFDASTLGDPEAHDDDDDDDDNDGDTLTDYKQVLGQNSSLGDDGTAFTIEERVDEGYSPHKDDSSYASHSRSDSQSGSRMPFRSPLSSDSFHTASSRDLPEMGESRSISLRPMREEKQLGETPIDSLSYTQSRSRNGNVFGSLSDERHSNSNSHNSRERQAAQEEPEPEPEPRPEPEPEPVSGHRRETPKSSNTRTPSNWTSKGKSRATSQQESNSHSVSGVSSKMVKITVTQNTNASSQARPSQNTPWDEPSVMIEEQRNEQEEHHHHHYNNNNNNNNTINSSSSSNDQKLSARQLRMRKSTSAFGRLIYNGTNSAAKNGEAKEEEPEKSDVDSPVMEERDGPEHSEHSARFLPDLPGSVSVPEPNRNLFLNNSSHHRRSSRSRSRSGRSTRSRRSIMRKNFILVVDTATVLTEEPSTSNHCRNKYLSGHEDIRSGNLSPLARLRNPLSYDVMSCD